MARVRPAVLAGAVAWLLVGSLVGLVGCSSGSSGSQPPGSSSPGSSSPSASSASSSASVSPVSSGSTAGLGLSRRYDEAPALLVQCGLSHGTIKPQTGQPWYADGKVLPLTGSGSDDHDAEFSTWWDANSTITIGGMTLSGWREWAASNDKLPPAVCGPSVSASALQAQVFPGQPNAWNG
jgi:hypothetical protein